MPKQPLPVSPKQVSHMGVGSKYDEFGKELPCKSIKEELACILGEVGEVEKNNDKKEGDPTSTVAGNSDEKVVIEIQIGAELSEKPSTKRKLGFLDDVDDIDIATGICPEFQTCKYCNVPIRTITWASHINCEWHRYHVA